MTTHTKVTILLAWLVVFCAGLLLYVHDRDVRRGERITVLLGQAARDSVVRDSLTVITTRSASVAARTVEAFRAVDTLWRRHVDTLTRQVPSIVQDTALADTAKITALVAIIDTLRRVGDSVTHVAERLASADSLLRANLVAERAAWTVERGTLTAVIRQFKHQDRRCGLGGAIGYGAIRVPSDGTIRTGSALVAGLVCRY